MKVRSIIIILVVLLLTGCNEEINDEFGYTLTKINDDACATMLEVVYTDEEYEYGFGCLESDRYIIKDEEGNEYSIYEVLENELLTIDEVYELFDGHLYRLENVSVTTIESEIEYLDFNVENLIISITQISIDEGGYVNWPFDGYPEIIDLEIDYQSIMDEFKDIIESTEDTRVCNMGAMGCVIFGPMPAFRIYFNDGVNFLSLSIDVEDIDGEQRISVIRVMEGNETRLTIPSSELRDEYDSIYEIIDSAYQEYLTSNA